MSCQSDRHPDDDHGDGAATPPRVPAPVPGPGQDDDRGLRDLFRASAPIGRPVDLEALFAAAEARRPKRQRRFFGLGLLHPAQGAAHRETLSPVPREKPFWKRSLSLSLRIAGGVLIATGIAGVATLLIPRESVANVTLAEVQATLERTQTLTCTMTEKSSAPAKQESALHRLLIRGPSLVRLENADRTYTITDFRRRKALAVDPAHRSVRVFEGLANPRNAPALNFYEWFRSIAANPIKTLPPREIAGKRAVGFLVRNPIAGEEAPQAEGPQPEITVWVDPQTKLPLRVEITTREEGGVTLTQITSDMVFDRPLDPALFELTPPAGYSVETFGVAQLRPEPAGQGAAELVVTPLEGIGPVKFGMKSDQVIKLLGESDKIVRPNQDLEVLEYYSRGFSIHASAQRGVLMIMCYTGRFWAFKVRDFAGRSDKGIRMGAGRAAIEKAYGPPSSVREARLGDVFGKKTPNAEQKTGQVDLSYNALRLSFSLHDDTLDSITILAPRPVAKKPAGAPPKP
jgi:outer membrane lipoprotein-sorting protein